MKAVGGLLTLYETEPGEGGSFWSIKLYPESENTPAKVIYK